MTTHGDGNLRIFVTIGERSDWTRLVFASHISMLSLAAIKLELQLIIGCRLGLRFQINFESGIRNMDAWRYRILSN